MTGTDPSGRRALVTGGAQGLGQGMAEALAAPAHGSPSPTCTSDAAQFVTGAGLPVDGGMGM